jgi:putative ABC transport system ATP-binding protein
MNAPRVLFADEPTGNLDAETGRQIMGVLENLHRQKNQTIVMVTHDPNDCAPGGSRVNIEGRPARSRRRALNRGFPLCKTNLRRAPFTD